MDIPLRSDKSLKTLLTFVFQLKVLSAPSLGHIIKLTIGTLEECICVKEKRDTLKRIPVTNASK